MVSFTKMCGAGNDFLITDHTRISEKNLSFFLQDFEKKIQDLCHRKFGLGADGVCLLTPSQEADFDWIFFNNDGSKASMCGNAACCIIQYAYEKNLIPQGKSPVTFKIGKHLLKGERTVQNENKLYFVDPKIVQKNIFLNLDHQDLKIDKVDSGVSHLLIELPDLSTFDQIKNNLLKTRNLDDKNLMRIKKQAQTLRKHDPKSNVTFYKKEDHKIHCVTFEKGVEDFTLACGTGAVAIAFFLKQPKDVSSKIIMPGGTLTVEFEKNQTSLISPVYLIGEMNSVI